MFITVLSSHFTGILKAKISVSAYMGLKILFMLYHTFLTVQNRFLSPFAGSLGVYFIRLLFLPSRLDVPGSTR